MATLVKDPITGTFSSNTDPSGTGRTMVDLNGGVVSPAQTISPTALPSTATPYDIFVSNITGMLSHAQQLNANNNQALLGQKNALQTQSVAGPNGPQTADTGVFAPQAVASRQGWAAAYAPAVTSLNDQTNANTANLNAATNLAGTLGTQFKPITAGPGESVITPGGQTIKQGHSYTPTINPITNQVDGFDQNTGTWASNDQTSPSPTNTGNSTTLAGVDFSSYATDKNWGPSVSGIYNTLSSTYPQPTADTIDAYIAGHASRSPVTGQMIMNAATQYGVDPNIITSVLAHESDFGTAGVATSTLNPGNIGNTGTSTQAYKSWQQGVNAVAQWAATHPSKTSATPASTDTSKVGGDFNNVYAQKIATLPAATQNYVDAGPFGVAYINDDRVPATVKASVQASAARAGVPYLATADVASLQSLSAAQQNMQNMKTAAVSTLGSGFWGGLGDIAATYTNMATFGNAFTNYAQFNGYASAAIAALKGLAGSGGGFRITQAEIDTAQANMPVSTDTIEHAKTKMQVLQGLINTTVAKIFPDAPIPIILKDGTPATVPAKNYSAVVAQGATPQ